MVGRPRGAAAVAVAAWDVTVAGGIDVPMRELLSGEQVSLLPATPMPEVTWRAATAEEQAIESAARLAALRGLTCPHCGEPYAL